MTEAHNLSPSPTRREEVPVGERLSRTIAELSETIGFKALALGQIPIYLDLVRQNLQEGWPSYAAALHPILNMVPGAIDPRYTETINADQLRYALEQGELRTVGALVVVGGLVGWFERRAKGVRGEIPVTGKDSLLYLNINGLPVAFSFAQEFAEKPSSRAGNLVYATLFDESETKPDRKPHPGFKKWYAEQVDFGMNVTDTEVLKRTGALRAPCVIIAGSNPEVIRINALSIQNWRNENSLPSSKIIPLPTVPFDSDSPITFTDPDSGEKIEIADKPINPYRYLRDRLKQLVSPDETSRKNAIGFFTEGVPESRRTKRQQEILSKLDSLAARIGAGPIKIYLNGDEGEESQLLKRFLTDVDTIEISADAVNADLILSYGESSITGDIKINEYADKIRAEQTLEEKVHLYLTFSRGNEDNASLSAEGGTSLQRMIVGELTERTSDYVKLKLTPAQVLRMAISRAFGNLIRRETSL